LVGLYREYKGYLDVLKHEGARRAHPDKKGKKFFHAFMCCLLNLVYFRHYVEHLEKCIWLGLSVHSGSTHILL